MNKAVDRLQELLDLKDEETRRLKEENTSLRRELKGALDGWLYPEEWPDDGRLPVPRLEMVYRPLAEGDWSRGYEVVHRLVYVHLEDQLFGVPLGRTVSRGYSRADAPPTDDWPFRQSAVVAYDAAHLNLPLYRIFPGREPELVDMVARGYDHQTELGRSRRRPTEPNDELWVVEWVDDGGVVVAASEARGLNDASVQAMDLLDVHKAKLRKEVGDVAKDDVFTRRIYKTKKGA